MPTPRLPRGALAARHLVLPAIPARARQAEAPAPFEGVTSIALRDPAGGVVAQRFGARKPGQPELESWRAIAGAVAERRAVTARSGERRGMGLRQAAHSCKCE